jgi:hypothetical protein
MTWVAICAALSHFSIYWRDGLKMTLVLMLKFRQRLHGISKITIAVFRCSSPLASIYKMYAGTYGARAFCLEVCNFSIIR